MMRMMRHSTVIVGVMLMLLLLLLLWMKIRTQHPSPESSIPMASRFDSLANASPQKKAGSIFLAKSAPLPATAQEEEKAANMLKSLLGKDRIQHQCHNLEVIRNRVEGERYYCRDKGFEVTPPCLVYSFGIDNDFGFDDAFADKGCHVFSFDPSMQIPSQRRSQQTMFYQMGLGGQDSDTFQPRHDIYTANTTNTTVWKMRTLSTLITMLKHTERTIDVLKMDIEGSEWSALRNMLDTGVLRQVKQVLVEWHIFKDFPAREVFQELITVLKDLKGAGFKVFSRVPHTNCSSPSDHFTLFSEDGYLNTRFING